MFILEQLPKMTHFQSVQSITTKCITLERNVPMEMLLYTKQLTTIQIHDQFYFSVVWVGHVFCYV